MTLTADFETFPNSINSFLAIKDIGLLKYLDAA